MELDAWYTDQALRFIRDHPVRTLKLKLMNIAYVLQPRLVPYYQAGPGMSLTHAADGTIAVVGAIERPLRDELAYALFYAAIALTALAGAFMRRSQLARDAMLYAIVAAFLVVCSVFFPTTRLRAPMDFVLMFFSACAIARWTARPPRVV